MDINICKKCTYINTNGNEDCKMCNFPLKVFNDNKKKCSACTFINDGNAKNCILCNKQFIDNKFTCKNCTYINNLQSIKDTCIMCNKRLITDKEIKIIENEAKARDIIPESFISSKSYSLPCTINGQTVIACVDSGADRTVINKTMAMACGLSDLIDERYGGKIKTVGSDCNIVGRIHMTDILVKNIKGDWISIPCSFLVLDSEQPFLFGIDMLKSHNATINFGKGILKIGENEIKLENE